MINPSAIAVRLWILPAAQATGCAVLAVGVDPSLRVFVLLAPCAIVVPPRAVVVASGDGEQQEQRGTAKCYMTIIVTVRMRGHLLRVASRGSVVCTTEASVITAITAGGWQAVRWLAAAPHLLLQHAHSVN